MWDLKKAHYLGALIAAVTVAITAAAIGTKYWATYDTDWDVNAFCDLEYKFDWGLFKYDSTTEYVCNGLASFKRERLNYAMDCDVVDENSCDNLHAAQSASGVALAMGLANLVLYLALSHYGSVSSEFLVLSVVLTFVQVLCTFTTVGAFSAIVNSYSEAEVTYEGDSGTTTKHSDVSIHTSDSWSMMLAAGVLSVMEFLISTVNVYTAKTQLQQQPAAVTAMI